MPTGWQLKAVKESYKPSTAERLISSGCRRLVVFRRSGKSFVGWTTNGSSIGKRSHFPHANPYLHGHLNPYADSDGDAHSHLDPHTKANCYPYSYLDRHANAGRYTFDRIAWHYSAGRRSCRHSHLSCLGSTQNALMTHKEERSL